MKYTLGNFIRSQYTTLPVVACPDLTGRVVMITGSNTYAFLGLVPYHALTHEPIHPFCSGLGYEAAKTFARHNPARLILAVRNTLAGNKAAREIVEAHGGKCTVLEVWQLDLGRLQSVKDFAETANRELDRLDVFISNAGITTEKFARTVDGFESTSQVNNIANSLLSILLTPLLRKTAHLPPLPTSPTFKPHLCIVSSAVHYWIYGVLPGMKGGRKDVLQCFQEEELFPGGSTRYNETKAVNVMNALTLADLLGPEIIVNTVNPGLCHSGLLRESVGIKGCLLTLLKLVAARSTEVGSRSLVWAATKDTPTGAYVQDCQLFEPSDFVISDQGREIGAEIWDEMKVAWKEKVGVDADAFIRAL
ncbi:hypothetical protein QFC24_006392 [Naganishia onofrii]|uniref:Uncharacterized protein n=1 Tax=Naganishia onofrii TaxID=1851511 RepID=A0ACC2X1V5_9TREE|nr:hypothetical protein QFC24_006392 [Naganishia onofrii]